MNPHRHLLLTLAVLPLLGAPAAVADVAEAHANAAPTPPAADRAAILAMAGEHRVTFEFDETVALRSGYEPRAPKTSAGTELVVVVEDSPTRIVLQHLLVDTRHHSVIKHWRQDWTWQDRALLEFRGERRWQWRQLAPEEAAGRWVQTVYEVDDSPRYASAGRWEHRGAVSEWVSDSTWRPLPRREHTTRDDYDVLVGVNRHIVTPWGWVHAQDNTKLDLRRNTTEPFIVKETGINTYRRVADVDFSAARRYWERTGEYWAAIRNEWTRRLAAAPGVVIELDVDGVPIMNSLLEFADDASQPLAERRRLAGAVIDKATQPLSLVAQP